MVSLTPLPPEAAIAAFERRGGKLVPSFSWKDVSAAEHAKAFTVAKSSGFDILRDLHDSLLDAQKEGKTVQEWSRNIRPVLEAKGWWGRKDVIDPLTGRQVGAQLGSSRRLQTIFDVNMRVSYAAGHWQHFERTKAARPILRYVAILDGRTRPEHAARHNMCAEVDDPIWDTWAPPCGWKCRCTLQSLTRDDLAQLGDKAKKPPPDEMVRHVNTRTGEVTVVPKGIDPGWGHNPGKLGADAVGPVRKALAAKLGDPTVPEPLATAVEDFMDETDPAAVKKRLAEATATAERLVVEKGKATGHEHMVSIDEATGLAFEEGTDGQANAVKFGPETMKAVADSSRRIALHHNHPSSSPLSLPDVRALSLPGVSSIAAYGHDGARYIIRHGTRYRDQASFLKAILLTDEASYRALQVMVERGLDARHAGVLHNWTRIKVLEQAGLIEAVVEPGSTWYDVIEANRARLDRVAGRIAAAVRKIP